jgi:hypothetical protein
MSVDTEPLHFLYPSDPLKTKRPDEFYAAEVEAMRAAGFDASVFSLEDLQAGVFRVFPPLPKAIVVYRGWMLSSGEYQRLESFLRDAGARPLSDTQTYLSAHHLPNWYPRILEFTPETIIVPADADLVGELRRLDWPAFFIKDYVKSLKTSVGSQITSAEQATTVASEMQRFRGRIEGGFCVRRVEDFLAETERRYFVIDARPFAATGEIPECVSECAKRIQSRFFSVDAVQRADGTLRIVEIGDGQVSDLEGWTPSQFAACWAKAHEATTPACHDD